MIINYTGWNYKKCLDITLPTWQGKKSIYSDSDEFGIKLFQPLEEEKNVANRFASEMFNESCRRKILTVRNAIKENPGENLAYLDTDVYMTAPIDEVFENPQDVICTRMVHRKRGYAEVNAGIFFMKANERSLKFCDEWLKMEEALGGKLPEQKAFNYLCFKGYDRQAEWTVGNVSEEVYNFERDGQEFIPDLQAKKPKLIHLKTKRWEDKESLQAVGKLLA